MREISWSTPFVKTLYPWAIKEALWLGGWLLRDDPTKELPALNYFRRVGLDYLYKSYSQGTVWTTIFIPPELLHALGLTPFCMEVVAAIFAGYERALSAGLQEADSQDVPTDVCTFHRMALGLALKGFFPKPLLLVGSSMLCDSGLKSLKLAETVTGKRLVTIDVPAEMNGDSIRYLAQQLEDLVGAVEEVTQKKMSRERLREALLCSNRARAKIQEINEMRADPGCPLKGSSALNFMLSSHIVLGSPGAERFYERLAVEIRERLQRNGTPEENTSPGPIKILWLEGKPYFNCELMRELEERHGVKIVFDELNYVYWEALDPERPYESLARKLISHHMHGPIERRLEVIKHLARRYSVDGIIAFSHWGCRRHLAAVPTLKRELEKEGYPFLGLDGDCVDSRNYMPGQFATRVGGFLEMLRGRQLRTAG